MAPTARNAAIPQDVTPFRASTVPRSHPAPMRRLLLALVILLPQLAAAAASVQVLDTFPAGTSLRLADGQNYYLHLGYNSDAPLHLWVRPYLRGKPANAGNNPSFIHPAGSGEALGWFFLMNPGNAVDEIRIETSDGATGNLVLLSLPVNIVGVARGAAPVATEPEWVTSMRAADKERGDREREQMMQSSSGGGGIAFALLGVVLLVIIGAIAWPIRAVRRWRGGWRTAALVPLAVMGFVVLRIFVGTLMDPTSHNLWPFELAMAGVVSVGAMMALVLARWFQGVKD